MYASIKILLLWHSLLLVKDPLLRRIFSDLFLNQSISIIKKPDDPH